MASHYVYLIACRGPTATYVKLGKSRNMGRRLSNIQTGCPYDITHAFAIQSENEEEVAGLERLLHRLLLASRLRGEWYEGSRGFFKVLDDTLQRVNAGDFTYDEINALPDFNAGPELEIMLHTHDFSFWELSAVPRSNPIFNEAGRIEPQRIADLLLRDSQ